MYPKETYLQYFTLVFILNLAFPLWTAKETSLLTFLVQSGVSGKVSHAPCHTHQQTFIKMIDHALLLGHQ
jgi:hypothetical protein